jgi:hypothetical protein
MFQHIPVKKEYLMAAGTAILLLFCYQLAFKKTMDAWQINRQLKARVARAADLSYQPAYLERKNSNLARIVARYKTDTLAFRSSSINTIAAIAAQEQVKLSAVPVQTPFYHADQFSVQKLGFEGGFFALEKVLSQLQASNGIGMVRSADFKLVEVRAGSKPVRKLVLEVYLETVAK